MDDLEEAARALLAAGFTVAELRSLGEAMMFGAIVAEETQRDFRVDTPNVTWTPEKKAAWDAWARTILRGG